MSWLSSITNSVSANGNSPDETHAAQIYQDIIRLGANRYDLLLPETRALPAIVHRGERLRGLVYGRYSWRPGQPSQVVGRGVLAATDKRVLLINKKPLFVQNDEISYGAISAVSYSRVWPMGVVVLHTRIGDIRLRSFNDACAKTFVSSIEACLVRSAADSGPLDDDSDG